MNIITELKVLINRGPLSATPNAGGGLTQEERSFFEENSEILEQIESLRREKLTAFDARLKISISIAIISVFIVGTYIFLNSNGQASILSSLFDLIGSLLLLIIFNMMNVFWMYLPKNDYVNRYKEEIIPKLLKLFGDFQYGSPMHENIENIVISTEDIEGAEIVPRYNRFRTEDCFAGEYKGINIKVSEVELYIVNHHEEYGSGTSSSSKKKTFEGLAILLDMGKECFHGHTIILEDKAYLSRALKEHKSGLRRVNLVDPEFEKLYDVFSSDQAEARYLIDPNMVKKIKTINDVIGGKSVRAAFYDKSKVLLLIESNQQFFEPDIYSKDSAIESMRLIKHQIEAIFNLIDSLSLCKMIGSRS